MSPKERYAYRKAQGLCAACGRSKEEVRLSTCYACRQKQRAKWQKKQRARYADYDKHLSEKIIGAFLAWCDNNMVEFSAPDIDADGGYMIYIPSTDLLRAYLKNEAKIHQPSGVQPRESD